LIDSRAATPKKARHSVSGSALDYPEDPLTCNSHSRGNPSCIDCAGVATSTISRVRTEHQCRDRSRCTACLALFSANRPAPPSDPAAFRAWLAQDSEAFRAWCSAQPPSPTMRLSRMEPAAQPFRPAPYP
jgi:hypothetical protein